MNKKMLMLSALSIPVIACGSNYTINANAENEIVNEVQTKATISINNYRIENFTDEGFDFIIKFNTTEDLTGVHLPYWKYGNYNGRVTNTSAVKIGTNEFKAHFKMSDIGSGTEYINLGIHPQTSAGSHFIADINIKLDTTNPNLNLSLSNTNWTNKDISLNSVSSDNQNIIEYLSYYHKDNTVTKYNMYSNPKILLIKHPSGSVMSNNISSKANVTTVEPSAITSVSQLKGYDIVIYDGHAWGVTGGIDTYLNQAYKEGVSIITNMNDDVGTLSIVSSGYGNVSDTYTLKTYTNGYSGGGGGRVNRFAYLMDNKSESDNHHYIKPRTGAFLISNSTYSNGTISPAVAMMTHPNGNKWIHSQTAGIFTSSGALYRAIDEIMCGTMKTRQTYNKGFTISENGTYSVEVEDFFGNKTKKSITVTNIDKTLPTLSITGNPTSWTPSATLTITGADDLSGVKEIVLPNGTIVTSSTTSYTVTANGNYTFKIRDKAGNETTQTISVTKIDNTINSLTGVKQSMSIVNATNSTRRMTFTFNPVSDTQSGLKGYSYVIDKVATTVPDNTVDTTSTTITKDITDTGVYYLHIKAVDNAGNVSSVIHHKVDIANLTTKSNPSENNIRLDWTLSDINNKTFKVYQKKPGSNTFQSVSATNFDSSKQVKVLNIYPAKWKDTAIAIEPTYKTWDGETISGVPISASLKKWMEEPNAEHPKGYGQGLIEVDLVEINDFNANPDKYLKDSNGNYKYDVLMFGTYDSNGYVDISTSAHDSTKAFLDSGRGVLFGHDTNNQANFKKLRGYINIQFAGDSLVPSSYSGYDYVVSSDEVLKTKTGLLTNTPWVIDTDRLYIPYSHTSGQFAFGDIWFKFDTTRPPALAQYGNKEVVVNGGTNNAYLSTYNNGAMIQTGHSNGKATSDEQKILANTLFYLNQLSTDNFLVDNSGQDVNAPTKPSLNTVNINTSGVATFNINASTDNGSTYEYYVESQTKDNDSLTLSNVKSETITSGLKGYSYVIDTKATTEPDDTVDTTSTSITSNVTSNNMYLHIKAIDNQGNASDTLHYQLTDTTKPTMTITGNPTSWTNQNITLTINGSDVGTGVKHIVLPNGNIVTGSNASYTVSANGNYTFKVVDKMGNETTQTISVTKIDKTIDNITGLNQTMTVVNTDTSTRRMTFTFNPVTDSLSGLKGYSYVIDKVATTVPDNTVDITATTITKDITDTGVYYLHIKAIDNAGNVSGVVHKKIDIANLTAKANPSENNIRLDWTLSDLKNKTFKVYQKKPGSDTFQSISATNFDSNEQVKVLNIHPNAGTSETFKTWDGETCTLPKSASLKKWMEEPNSEHAKGYGQGLIEVTPVTQDDFNANPSKYLTKDSNGNWNYDVVMIGSWDDNNYKRLNDTGLAVIKSFIEDGYGYLMGHDTTSGTHLELLPYLNIRKPGDKDVPTSYSNDLYRVGDNKIINNKKGLLTNFPWLIDKQVLSIPQTHTSYQWVYGDVWFDFEAVKNNVFPSYGNQEIADSTGKGTNNYYLTTWNNTAMIQTGHTNGSATSDEQKILANTLFYLKQLSNDNYLVDNSGQDVTAPNKPVISGAKFTEDGYINLSFNSVTDNGSTYEYYVESQTKDNDSLTLSNVVKSTITSGIKGYSYVVDNNATTIPDNTIEQATNETIKIKTNNSGELYVHIKAIDNVGNESETYHYRITDTTKPTLTVTQNPATWTNGSVTLTATASDSGSGVKYIILPNGNKVSSSTASYTVDKNGMYYFKAVDYMGNETVQGIRVTNIDKLKPTVTITNNQNWTNQNIQVTITSKDE